MKSNCMHYGVLIALLLAAGPASAQMGDEDTGRSGMMGGGGGNGPGMAMHGPEMEMGGMGAMTKVMRAASKLNLTAEQRKKLQLSTLQHQKDAIPLLGQVRMAGVEIQELLLVDPVNLDKVKAKVKEKYDAAAKLEMSHLALTQEIKKMLTPEQRQRMESMMMQMGPMTGSMPMMDPMMGSSSGPAKAEPAPSEAPGGPKDGPESKDPHGH